MKIYSCGRTYDGLSDNWLRVVVTWKKGASCPKPLPTRELELENYTFLTAKAYVKTTNVFEGFSGAKSTGFSNVSTWAWGPLLTRTSRTK